MVYNTRTSERKYYKLPAEVDLAELPCESLRSKFTVRQFEWRRSWIAKSMAILCSFPTREVKSTTAPIVPTLCCWMLSPLPLARDELTSSSKTKRAQDILFLNFLGWDSFWESYQNIIMGFIDLEILNDLRKEPKKDSKFENAVKVMWLSPG